MNGTQTTIVILLVVALVFSIFTIVFQLSADAPSSQNTGSTSGSTQLTGRTTGNVQVVVETSEASG